MRKKSHISLAKYIANSSGMEDLKNHKKSLYIGSVLPDCMPSFITRRHSIDETFHILKKEILKITEDYNVEKGISNYYCRHLGIITHYIADYFTFPHNDIFTGSIKEHCIYEKELKFELKSYVCSSEAERNRMDDEKLHTAEELFDFIERMHSEYLKAIKIVKMDCIYIVELCHKVVDAILHFFENEFNRINAVTNFFPI